MATLEEIDKLLHDCAGELDRCAGLIRDAQLNPVTENIYRIGHALYNVCEIRNEIFKLKPELMPKEWNERVADEEQNRIFGELLIETEALCEAGKPLVAIERLENFVGTSPGDSLAGMAKHEITSIRSRYGV